MERKSDLFSARLVPDLIGWLTLKVREVISLIEEDGWVPGSRAWQPSAIQARNQARTSAGHMSDDLAPGTLNSILKQAGLKEKR